MDEPSFIAIFQEIPRVSSADCAAATSTHTLTNREEADVDPYLAAAATQTMTKTEREEPDADPQSLAALVHDEHARASGTATRTDSREETDQDRSFETAMCVQSDGSPSLGRLSEVRCVVELSFVWRTSAFEER